MITTTLCFNCQHAEVCKFLESVERAFEGFPFKEDPKYKDSESLVSLNFDDIEPAVAGACEHFLVREDGAVREYKSGEE